MISGFPGLATRPGAAGKSGRPGTFGLPRGERLVRARRARLTAPLLELGSLLGARPGHVQAQAAVLVLELPLAIAEGDREPERIAGAVRRVLDHLGTLRRGGAEHGKRLVAVLVRQLA